MSVQQIKAAIEEISPVEYEELQLWMSQNRPRRELEGFGKFAHLGLSSDLVAADRQEEIERDEEKWEERCRSQQK